MIVFMGWTLSAIGWLLQVVWMLFALSASERIPRMLRAVQQTAQMGTGQGDFFLPNKNKSGHYSPWMFLP